MKQCPEARNILVYDIVFYLLQGTQGMNQCPEERNILVYDVMFSLLQGTQGMKQCPEERNIQEIEKQKKKLEEEN